MTVREVAEKLGLKVLAGVSLDRVVTGGYCSDLLSDVMARAKEGNAWLTIQTHKNIVAVAVLTGVAAVVVTGGRSPDAETLAKAVEEGVPILASEATSFEVAGKLYGLLNAG